MKKMENLITNTVCASLIPENQRVKKKQCHSSEIEREHYGQKSKRKRM